MFAGSDNYHGKGTREAVAPGDPTPSSIPLTGLTLTGFPRLCRRGAQV